MDFKDIPKEVQDFAREYLPWFASFGVALFAAVTRHAEKLRKKVSVTWRELVADATICAFVGLVAHLSCEVAGIVGVPQVLIVALSAHEGTRALMQYERLRERLFGPDWDAGRGNKE